MNEYYDIFRGLMSMCSLIGVTPPSAVCLQFEFWVLFRLVVSNFLIFLAYMGVPFLMKYISKKRGDITGDTKKIWDLFSYFVIACGVGHLVSIFSIFVIDAIYFESYYHFFTAIISVITCIVLIKNVDRLIQLKTPTQYETIVEKYEQKNKELSIQTKQLKALLLAYREKKNIEDLTSKIDELLK